MSEQTAPHEKLGFDLLKRAFAGGSLELWEEDYARLFWQLLEVCNGGFEQWIGNTGPAGVADTLAAMERFSLPETRGITVSALNLVAFGNWTGDQPFYDYLRSLAVDWHEQLLPLNKAYWELTELDSALRTKYEQISQQ